MRIDSDAKNEFQKTLYAHTSPVYVTYKGKDVFEVESAVALLKQVEQGQGIIRTRGHFSNADASKALLAVYDEAAQNLANASTPCGIEYPGASPRVIAGSLGPLPPAEGELCS